MEIPFSGSDKASTWKSEGLADQANSITHDILDLENRELRNEFQGWAESLERSLKNRQETVNYHVQLFLGGRKMRSSYLAEQLFVMAMPELNDVIDSWQRLLVRIRLTKIAIEVERFRLKYRHYPQTLSQITWLKPELKSDPFCDEQIKFLTKPYGCLIYSVGQSGRDHGGKGYLEETGDDILIRLNRKIN